MTISLVLTAEPEAFFISPIVPETGARIGVVGMGVIEIDFSFEEAACVYG